MYTRVVKKRIIRITLTLFIPFILIFKTLSDVDRGGGTKGGAETHLSDTIDFSGHNKTYLYTKHISINLFLRSFITAFFIMGETN